MSTSAINNNNQAAANPFSDWKSTVNLDPNHTVVSNLPNDVATLILSYLPVEQAQTVMDSTGSQMDRYNVYRGVMGDVNCLDHNEHAKSSYTGKELEKFQRLLSLKGLIDGQPPVIKPWAELLAGEEISLTRLKNLDLSDSPNMTDADVTALTKSSPNLNTLILPGAFSSDEVMAVLKTNCPQAAIYPSAMTEQEWAHPAEFMAKLPPPPQAIADFINSPRPIWEGKTSAEIHMVMPKVNKIIKNVNVNAIPQVKSVIRRIDDNSIMVPWTLDNVSKLDKATGGLGCQNIGREFFDEIKYPANNKPSEVGFEWVVFTKDTLPGSENQTYNNLKQQVEHWGYEVPGFAEAATCMLWETRLSGNRIYSTVGTRCKDNYNDVMRILVGYFAPTGLQVLPCYEANFVGVGGIRKFKI